MSDFDFEPVRGLPERLPSGERLIWQGAPEFRKLAIGAFKVRIAGVYFLLLMAWQVATRLSDGAAPGEVLASLGLLAVLAASALGMLLGLAWAAARSTVYTITTERVVMRFGIALPMTINLPFSRIVRASLKVGADGVGDIPLELARDDKVAYLVLWPHARPRHYARPEPMLRAIADAAKVASMLAAAMRAYEQRAAPAAEHESLTAANDDAAPRLSVIAAE